MMGATWQRRNGSPSPSPDPANRPRKHAGDWRSQSPHRVNSQASSGRSFGSSRPLPPLPLLPDEAEPHIEHPFGVLPAVVAERVLVEVLLKMPRRYAVINP